MTSFRKTGRAPAVIIALILVLGLAGPALFGQPKKALTFTDMMKFRHLRNPVISEDGEWVAFASQPDRGDGEGMAVHVKTGKTHVVPRGARPVLSADGRWAGFTILPKAEEVEKAGKDKPKPGMVLVDLDSGRIHETAGIDRFAFSEDGAWLAVLLAKEDKKDATPETKPEAKPPSLETGADLVLRRLATGEEIRTAFVTSFAFDKASSRLACAAAHPDGKANGVFLRDLGKPGLPKTAVHQAERGSYRNLAWSDAGGRLAFIAGLQDDKARVRTCSLWRWDPATARAVEAVPAAAAPEGWIIPAKNELTWSEDGRRLFFGLKPADMEDPSETQKTEDKDAPLDLFDWDSILAKREVDVWHWNDPFINSHQKKMWNRLKDQ
ncbi:MAG: PD40 domain-containing protein, partial [Candidatus Aminicenantes bacterium]|nr:PD40 domain-containing protein [Candidatus Aminicenantes bacterium]